LSYDLLVFGTTFVPRCPERFLGWHQSLFEDDSGQDEDPSDTLPENLRSFFDCMRCEYPPMNGQFAADFGAMARLQISTSRPGLIGKLLGPRVTTIDATHRITEYSFFRDAIYLSFAWSVAQEAHARVFNMALLNNLGFFNPQMETPRPLFDRNDFDAFMRG